MNQLLPLARAGGQGLKAVFALLKLLRPERPIHSHGVHAGGHSHPHAGLQW